MEKKYNYTYQIKNLLNGKTYIGVHSTDDLDDGYMGSGVRLKQSMEKHGIENFVKTIMCFFDTANEMYEEEKFLVDEKWVKSQSNYNMTLGGNGGYTFYGKTHSEETKRKMSETRSGENHPNYGKTHSEETKRKMSGTNSGENNPRFKNKKDGLPVYISIQKGVKKNPYYVRVKRKYVGVFPTLEEAVIGKDKYLEKLQQIS